MKAERGERLLTEGVTMYTSHDDIRAMHTEAGQLYRQAGRGAQVFTMLTSSLWLIAWSLASGPVAGYIMALIGLIALIMLPSIVIDGIRADRLRRKARRAHGDNWRQSAIDHRARHSA